MNITDIVYAQECPPPPLPCIRVLPGTAFDSVDDALLFVIRGLFILAGGLAVLYLFWSGLQYLTAGGNPEQAQKARNGLLYAIIGIVIVSLSFAIVNVVSNTLRIGSQNSSRTSSEASQERPPENTSSPGGGRLPVE